MFRLNQPWPLVGVCIGMLLGGTMLLAGSVRTEQREKDLPRMTCEELARKGRDVPQFVTLRGVRMCQQGYAFHRDMDAAMEMYVPVFSAALPMQPPAADLTMILEILDDRPRKQLIEQPDVDELPVQLGRETRNLDPWVGAQLSQFYPGLQFDNCRLLSVGLHEPSALRARGVKGTKASVCCCLRQRSKLAGEFANGGAAKPAPIAHAD